MPVASTSIAALRTTAIGPIRETVLEIIESYGAAGCITDDVISHFPLSGKTNTGRITGRFSELENEGKMVRMGDTRVGVSGKRQLVMRGVMYAATLPLIPAKKKKRNPFLAGMMFAAKLVVKASDLDAARAALKTELIKAARR